MKYKLSEKIKIKSTNIVFIKFASAIAVIISHAPAVTSKSEDIVSVATKNQCNLGGIAVAVFFFLSGMYVSKSLDRSCDLAEFIKKRCVRIFPQLWMVVLLSIAIGGLFLSSHSVVSFLSDANTYKYLLNAFLLPVHDLPGVFDKNPYSTVNGPLWTLPVEFACYIMLAIVMWLASLINRKNVVDIRVRLNIVMFVFFSVLFMALYIFAPKSMAFTAVRPMLIFFEGVLYYDHRDKILLDPLIGIGCICVLVFIMRLNIFNIGLVIFLPYAIISLALSVSQATNLPDIFNASYEMYLLGWPIQQIIVDRYSPDPVVNCAVAIPVDVLLAYILYLVTKRLTVKRFAA